MQIPITTAHPWGHRLNLRGVQQDTRVAMSGVFELFFVSWFPPLLVSFLICFPLWRYLQKRWAWTGTLLLVCVSLVLTWLVGRDNDVVVNIVYIYLPWLVPLLICGHIWPFLRRKRHYVVTAAILCLTPIFAFPGLTRGFILWPLILGLLSWTLRKIDGPVWFLEGLLLSPVQTGIPIGFIVWLLCKKYLPSPVEREGKKENE